MTVSITFILLWQYYFFHHRFHMDWPGTDLAWKIFFFFISIVVWDYVCLKLWLLVDPVSISLWCWMKEYEHFGTITVENGKCTRSYSKKILFLCEFWDFYWGVPEDSLLMSYDTASLGNRLHFEASSNIILNCRPLNMNAICWLEASGSDYPVTEAHISEEENPEPVPVLLVHHSYRIPYRLLWEGTRTFAVTSRLITTWLRCCWKAASWTWSWRNDVKIINNNCV